MKRPKTRRISAIIALICLIWACPGYSADFHPAQAKDISDRAYEDAVIDLLDSAKESIVLSMYIIKPSEKGPVALLVKDLEEALERGVSVEIYLNTKFRSEKAAQATEEKPFRLLKEKGAVIRQVDSNYRLHDKLIIVDSRYVVEGSTNWSVSALKSNFESSTLIDSTPLARIKLKRLKGLPTESDKPERIRKREGLRRVGRLPEGSVIRLNKALLENKRLLPEMVIRHDERSMDTYLLLLAEEKRWPSPRKGESVREGFSAFFGEHGRRS